MNVMEKQFLIANSMRMFAFNKSQICGELVRIAHIVSSSLDFYSSPPLFSLGFTTVTTPRLD